MPINALLKLLVKDKTLYSVYFTAEKYMKEGKRNLGGERNEVTADERQPDWQLKTPRETEDYSRQGPTSTES